MWLCEDSNACPLAGTVPKGIIKSVKVCNTEKELSFSVHSELSAIDIMEVPF